MRPREGRPLAELVDDASGQLVVEWVLLMSVVVIPLIVLVPTMLQMIHVYYYRIAEMVCLPFP